MDDNDEFDADLLLELTEDPGWSAEDYVKELYKALRSSSRYRGMVSRHARCVKVDYANEFHVDVVPYVERHGEHYICNRDNDEFELTNPEGFNEWLDQQDQTTGGKLIKVIRLFKYLRDYKNTFSVKSVILNILVGGRVNSALLLGDPGHYQDLPTAFRNLLADLNDYLQANPTMPNLTDPSCRPRTSTTAATKRSTRISASGSTTTATRRRRRSRKRTGKPVSSSGARSSATTSASPRPPSPRRARAHIGRANGTASSS